MAASVYEQGGPGDHSTLSWYVARSATRQEKGAIANLEEIGFTVWMPVETFWRHPLRSVAREIGERPLYPGYLFVLARDRDLHRISGCEKVSGLVTWTAGEEERPMAVPLRMVLALQAEEKAGDFDRTRQTKAEYRPKKGARVQITAGPWMSFFAKVLATPRKQRASVMIEGPFGRGHVVDIRNMTPAA